MGTFRCIAILRDIAPNFIEDIVDVLIEEGIKELEISLSNEEYGYQVVQKVLNEYKGKLRIGAGTVTKLEQVEMLYEMGIDFIITPAFDSKLVIRCKELNLEVIPGVFSPKDVMEALNLGVTKLKLFPADTLPLNYIKNLKGPFPKAEFLAVGGVNLSNIRQWKEAGFIGVAPGNDLVKRGSTLDDLEEIRSKAKRYIEVISNEGF